MDGSFITKSLKNKRILQWGGLESEKAKQSWKLSVYIAAQLFWRLRLLLQSFIRKKATFIEALSFVILWDLNVLGFVCFVGKKKSIHLLTCLLLVNFSNPEKRWSSLNKVQCFNKGHIMKGTCFLADNGQKWPQFEVIPFWISTLLS